MENMDLEEYFRKQLENLKRDRKMLDKIEADINEKLKVVNSTDYDELKKLLCWGSIAYCCGTEKKCPFRDYVLMRLGITHREYEKLKKRWDIEFKAFIRQKESAETV